MEKLMSLIIAFFRHGLCLLVPLGVMACSSSRVQVRIDCPDRTEDTGSQFRVGPADQLLREFGDALGRYPIEAESSYEDIGEYIAKETRALLMPQKDLLHLQALWYFKLIPLRQRQNTDGWDSPVPHQMDLRDGITDFSGMQTASDFEAAEFYSGWEMQAVFNTVRLGLYGRIFPSTYLRAAGQIAGWSYFRLIRLNSDGDHPVLAIQGEREFFALTLRYDKERGIYQPVKVEWLFRKLPVEPAQNTSSESVSETPGAVEVLPDAEGGNNSTMSVLSRSLVPDESYMAANAHTKRETRYAKWRAVSRIQTGQSHLSRVELSADGQFILAMSEMEATARVYRARSRELLGNWAMAGFAAGEFRRGDVAFWPTASEESYFIAGNERGLTLYSALDGRLVAQLSSTPVWQMRFSKDGHYLMTLESDISTQTSRLSFYQVGASEGSAPLLTYLGQIDEKERIDDMALSADNQRLALLLYPSSTVVVFDVASGQRQTSFDAPSYANSIDFSPDDKLLAVGGAHLLVVSLENPQMRATYRGYNNNIDTVRFSPSGDAIATSAYDGHIRIVNTRLATGTLKLLKDLRHRGTANVYSVAFTQNGEGLISGSGDQSIVVWGKQVPTD